MALDEPPDPQSVTRFQRRQPSNRKVASARHRSETTVRHSPGSPGRPNRGRPHKGARTMATITGTNASNNLNGTNLADQISGLGGNDILIGFDGDDVLEGGDGADQLFGSSGFDTASYRSSTAGVTSASSSSVADGGDADGRRALQHRGRARLGVRGQPCGRRPAQHALRRGRRRRASRPRRQRPARRRRR